MNTSKLTFERLQDALGERSPLGVAGDIDAHVRAVVREMLAENATPAEKPEKPAVTTFDFGDGKGPVPAHKHPNGGGWVADTATVAEAAYVGPGARVYGNARVFGNIWVYENARVTK